MENYWHIDQSKEWLEALKPNNAQKGVSCETKIESREAIDNSSIDDRESNAIKCEL